MSDLLSMGGYGWYVGMAYGVCALAIAAEALALRSRRRRAIREARLADDMAPTGAAR